MYYFYIVIKKQNYKKRQNINLKIYIMNRIKQNPGQSIFVSILFIVALSIAIFGKFSNI